MASSPSPFALLKLKIRRLSHWWGARSLALGGFTSIFDVCTLYVCVQLLGFPRPLGTMSGALVGNTLSFFLNRRFAFRQHSAPAAPQAVRFAITLTIAILFHSALVATLLSHTA